MKICVGGRSVEIDPSDTVDTLKVKVQEMTGIPAQRQRLDFDGRRLEDGHLISEYRCCVENSYIDLNGSMELYVQTMAGRIIVLRVMEQMDNIENVKGQIQKIEGIPARRQRYFFNGTEIQGRDTLYDHNIPEKGIIHLRVCLCGLVDC